jgi:hypothetical protein
MRELEKEDAIGELNALLKLESWQKVQTKLVKIVIDQMVNNQTLELFNIKVTKNNKGNYFIKLKGE